MGKFELNEILDSWATREKPTGPKFKRRVSAQQRASASGPSDEVGATCQRLIIAEAVWASEGRWIRSKINGSQPSSSPTSDGFTGGEGRGSTALPAFPRGSAGGEARLSTMRERLVAVARLGAASIGGGDLRAPADFSFRLMLLRRGGVKLTGGEEARMGGERVGVKRACWEGLYL